MKSRTIENLIACYQDHEELSADEYARLSKSLESNSDLVLQCIDDRAVDGMLQLLATEELDESEFVARCLERMTAETATNKVEHFNSVVPNESSGQQGEFAIDVGRVATTRVRSNKVSPKARFSLQFWISIAACALFLASITARLLVDSNRNVSRPYPNPALELNQNEQATRDKRLVERPETKAAAPREFEPRIAQNAGPEFEKPDDQSSDGQSMATHDDITPNDAQSDSQIVDAGQPARGIALVVGKPGTVWEPEIDIRGDRIEPGEYRLASGKSAIEFDSGVVIVLQAPAAIVLHSQRQLHLADGELILEVPQHVKDFELTTNNARFVDPTNTQIQIAVQPGKGTVAQLLRGTIQQRTLDGETEQGLQLSQGGVFQSVVRSLAGSPDVSKVVIARGKDKFVGQIGDGENRLETDSPVVMANVLSEISEDAEDSASTKPLLRNWPDFIDEVNRRQLTAPNQLMELMRKYGAGQSNENSDNNLSYGGSTDSSSFQGSISINGKMQSFDSSQEFEKAMRQIRNRFELPDVNQFPNQPFDNLPGFSGNIDRR